MFKGLLCFKMMFIDYFDMFCGRGVGTNWTIVRYTILSNKCVNVEELNESNVKVNFKRQVELS